jgi:hypothetical protein
MASCPFIRKRRFKALGDGHDRRVRDAEWEPGVLAH